MSNCKASTRETPLVRHAIKVTRRYSLSILAVAYLTQREMMGLAVSNKDAETILACFGATKDLAPVEALTRAKKFINGDRDVLKKFLEESRPELIAALINAGREDLAEQIERDQPTARPRTSNPFGELYALFYIVLTLFAIAAIIGFLCAPYFGFMWLYKEYWWTIDWPEFWSVVLTVLLWAGALSAIFAKRFTIPFLIRLVRGIRRSFQRIEEATRP